MLIVKPYGLPILLNFNIHINYKILLINIITFEYRNKVQLNSIITNKHVPKQSLQSCTTVPPNATTLQPNVARAFTSAESVQPWSHRGPRGYSRRKISDVTSNWPTSARTHYPGRDSAFSRCASRARQSRARATVPMSRLSLRLDQACAQCNCSRSESRRRRRALERASPDTFLTPVTNSRVPGRGRRRPPSAREESRTMSGRCTRFGAPRPPVRGFAADGFLDRSFFSGTQGDLRFAASRIFLGSAGLLRNGGSARSSF